MEFKNLPFQYCTPREYCFSVNECKILEQEINKLLVKGVIQKAEHLPHEFISGIFLREKKDGSYRMILNLKQLNEFIVYRHFKMETLQSALNLMSKNCWMASIDWKEAYYSCNFAEKYRKFLRFLFKGHLYEFTALPNGFAAGPRLFTKITKPLFSHLRKLGFMNTSYIDDSLLFGNSIDECRQNVMKTVDLSLKCGFLVHPVKSVFEPCQIIEYLGFVLNSKEMTVKLTENRVKKLKLSVSCLLNTKNPTIQQVSEVVGQMVASFPGVLYGPLYYRCLDNEKSKWLKIQRGHYSSYMSFNTDCVNDLQWWLDNIDHTHKPLFQREPSVLLQSDASKIAWGGVYGSQTTGGSWSSTEINFHINVLELLAAYFTIRTFCTDMQNVHIKLMSDNQTTVAYINNMGGKKDQCNAVARKIWFWCISKNIWLSAAYLPGIENTEADAQSRMLHDNTEWKLHSNLFKAVIELWHEPHIDMFASRLNYQLQKYVSWKPDPFACAIDAFNMSWQNLFIYAFPPFSVIGKVLQKIEHEAIEAIVIVPYWTTQSWFNKFMNLLIDCPFFLPRECISHPVKELETHLPKMKLMVGRLSGNSMKAKTFRQELLTFCCRHGGKPLVDNITYTCLNGVHIAGKETLIHFHHL